MPEEIKTQREHKDRLFKAIFGRDTKESRRWRLDLYNALNGTAYTDPDALELNTIENVIYITMRNDVSFLVDDQMCLYEQQSSYNPNMPLRGLMYFSQLYKIHLVKNDKILHSETIIKIPSPRFLVFYNGSEKKPDSWKMRLSDAFQKASDEIKADFEWAATVINLNKKRNQALQKKCEALYSYVAYTSKVAENKKAGMEKAEAVEAAVDWAISKNLLDGFFERQRAEVMEMSLTEFDEEEFRRCMRADGREEKAVEDAVMLVRKYNAAPEVAAQDVGAPLDRVLEALSAASAQA